MPSHGTPSTEIPGWYIRFQADVLLQLPRPEDISEAIADGWHNNRGAMQSALRTALCPPASRARERFPIWRFVTLGTYLSAAEMMEDFVRIDGPRINDSAVELLKMLTFFNHKLEINLVKVSGADLGFKTDAKRDHIFNQAAAFGLLTVPAQVGPELRLQIPIGMPESELCIGMDPIAVSSIAEMAIFKLGSQYLMTADGTSFRKWPPSQEWIFRASDQR